MQVQCRLQRGESRSFAVQFVGSDIDDTDGRKYGDVFYEIKRIREINVEVQSLMKLMERLREHEFKQEGKGLEGVNLKLDLLGRRHGERTRELKG